MNSRSALEKFSHNLEDSMGVRIDDSRPNLSPAPKLKDVGRQPLRSFGEIDINLVVPDPNQPRKKFDDESIRLMGENMKTRGQLQPVRVRWSDELDKWVIIAGERRWRAAKSAGITKIICFFHEDDLTSSEILEESLMENVHREDLTPIEEARAYAELMRINEWSGRQLAEAVGVSSTRVSRTLSLLRLPADIRDAVQAGVIPARSAYEISKLKNEKQQQQLAQQASAGSLTHDKTARAVRQRRGTQSRSRGTKLTFLAENGWRITVSHRKLGSYPEVEAALNEVLDEVRHRAKNRVRLN